MMKEPWFNKVEKVLETKKLHVYEVKAQPAPGEVPDCVKRAVECFNTVEPNKRIFQEILDAIERMSHRIPRADDTDRALMEILDLASGFTNTTSYNEGEFFSFDYGIAKKYLIDERLWRK